MIRNLTVLFIVIIIVRVQSQDRFTILQFNDIASQLESFKEGTDPPEPTTNDDAVGGLAKLIGELEFQEASIAPGSTILRISPGNLIGGFNGWLSVLGYGPFTEAVQKYYSIKEEHGKKYFLQGFGLKEFEGGIRQVNTYIDKANKPIISNIDCIGNDLDEGDELFCGHNTAEALFLQRKIINVGSTQVGVVGFVNPLAMNLSDPGNLILNDVAKSLKELTSRYIFKDIKTVIAIGGGSLDIAKQVLSNVDKVKLVIYAGGSEKRAYPTDFNGKYIAATSELKYGANLGKMTFTIKADGGLSLVKGEIKPVRDRRKDEVQAWVHALRTSETMVNATEVDIGRTLVRLEGTREACWRSECNLGNLVADSLVHCAVNKVESDDGINIHALVDLFAVWNGGSLFNDIVEQFDDIKGLDIHKWFPYHNNAYLVILKGRDLKQMFRESGKSILAGQGSQIDDWGRLLQVSDGVEVFYGYKGELKSLKVWHTEDQIPLLQDVQDDKDYHLVMPSTLYRGRNAYAFLKDKFQQFPSGRVTFKSIDFDDNCLRHYIEAMGVLNIGFQGRIFIGTNPYDCSSCSKGTALTVFLTILIFTIILGLAFVSWKFLWPMIVRRRRTSSFP